MLNGRDYLPYSPEAGWLHGSFRLIRISSQQRLLKHVILMSELSELFLNLRPYCAAIHEERLSILYGYCSGAFILKHMCLLDGLP